jgi:alpha-L-rhamnosidase
MRSPTKCTLFITALCLAWAVSPTPAAAQGGPVRDLRCENATNPRGVKAPRPQLSWTWGQPRPPRAYQVLVASSEEKLKADEADLWDSGRVLSDRKTVQYQGKALSSLERCFWKVRVWNDYDTAGAYSDPASWEMGLLFFADPEPKAFQGGHAGILADATGNPGGPESSRRRLPL